MGHTVCPSQAAKPARPCQYIPVSVGQPNRLQVAPTIATRDVYDAISMHWRRNRIHRSTAALPNDFPRLKVIARHVVHRWRNNLGTPTVLNDQRRRPRIDLIAIHSPALLAGAFIERYNE